MESIVAAAIEEREPGHASGPRDDDAQQVLIEEELLVEDISIDGMCGVY